MNIEENIGVWNGCEFSELIVIALSSFFITLIVLILLSNFNIALIAAVIVMIFSVFFGSKILQNIKRNKPKNYYQKKLALFFGIVKNNKQFNTLTKL
jgi:conjugative transfer region protein (TIGR03750 family)